MKFAGKISQILDEAERQLNALAVEALAKRDYEAASQIAAVAKRLAMADEDSDGPSNVPLAPPEAAASESRASRAVSESQGIQTNAISKDFPRFHRDGDYLVKTGFSKSDRRIYQHRCPRDVLDRVADEIGRLTVNRTAFSTDQLMPARRAELADVPLYQIYLSLGFLMKRGIVRRRGRSEYIVSDNHGSELSAAVQREWKALYPD